MYITWIISMFILLSNCLYADNNNHNHNHHRDLNSTSDTIFKFINIQKSKLPYVYILPISSKYNIDIENYHNEMQLEGLKPNNPSKHSQDAKFIHYLNTTYLRTVHEKHKHKAEIYFLPLFLPKHYSSNLSFWSELDTELYEIVRNSNIKYFSLDLCFMSVTHPLGFLHFPPHPRIRNLQDLRMLRSDTEYTTNGRDIFIPYIDNKNYWSNLINNIIKKNNEKYEKRMYFLFADCTKAVTKNEYRYKNQFLNYWNNYLQLNNTNIIINSNINSSFNSNVNSNENLNLNQNFNENIKNDIKNNINKLKYIIINNNNTIKSNIYDNILINSDFCLIFPGDTASTANLYKAIFAGCIPIVFVSNYQSLPFYYYINYNIFSIIILKDIINNNNNINELIKYILNIYNNKQLLLNYKLYLFEISQLFDYSKIDYPNIYDLTLLELKRTSVVKMHANKHINSDILHSFPNLLPFLNHNIEK